MKGVILAGGYGTRLKPLTNIINKHLLPVYNKPMIYYPVNSLVKAGIKNILIVTGPENCGDFMKLLGSGKVLNKYRIKVSYASKKAIEKVKGSGGEVILTVSAGKEQ
ncbi:MAG: uL15 family ribosomal protein [Nanoarchaeota archaeon]